jgi:hypothetical protein
VNVVRDRMKFDRKRHQLARVPQIRGRESVICGRESVIRGSERHQLVSFRQIGGRN